MKFTHTVDALMENDSGSHAHCMGSSTPISTLWVSYPFAPWGELGVVMVTPR